MPARSILVTSALPYANGHIHLGHLVEYIQSNIWVRFQRLCGHRCLSICADDTHGTAIMIRAREEGRSEEALIADMQAHHIRDFTDFDIHFDNYGSTHCEENRQLCHTVWAALRRAGMVVERQVEQLFDCQAGVFLADRFVRGTCPYCGLTNQEGGYCENGHTYGPTEMVDPISTLSGTRPEIRAADHLFIQLEPLHEFLDEWSQSGRHLQSEVANYLKGHFLGEPLRDWDVSRPAPYFGFEIPDSPGNYWYVWFDAPIGYMASTAQWCQASGEDFDDWWRSDRFELHHFIGKDITYFHTLFWPGMLKTAGFRLPTKVHIHGFLTVDGEKMAKSKGTFVRARVYLDHLDPSYLRYYYASKLGPRVDDIDLNLEEFAAKVNSDLVGKVVNLASRTAKFVSGERLAAAYPDDGGLFRDGAAAGETIREAYEACDYNRAMRVVMGLADRANAYIDEQAPWKLAKDRSETERLREICTVGLNLFRQIAVYLAPVLPRLSEQTGRLLGEPITRWSDSQTPLLDRPVARFEHMLQRVVPRQVAAMIEASCEGRPPAARVPAVTPATGGSGNALVRSGGGPGPAGPGPDVELQGSAGRREMEVAVVEDPMVQDSDEPLVREPLAPECTIEDFAKVDLRVARVVHAETVPEARKLLKLTLSLGGTHHKTVFAGIKEAYRPEDLVGRLVICVANLAPRQMKFGTSEGMVVAAGGGGSQVYLLAVDAGAVPGERVH